MKNKSSHTKLGRVALIVLILSGLILTPAFAGEGDMEEGGFIQIQKGPPPRLPIDPGWPQEIGGNDAVNTPTLSDLDQDGDLEVIMSSNEGDVYVWHHDGTLVSGWPQRVGGTHPFILWSSATAVDLDPERAGLEVVVASGDGFEGNVYVWHHDGTLVSGWPRHIDDQIWSSPAIGNLDNKEGLEVVVTTRHAGVFVFHADGTPVHGWPQPYGLENSTPVISDLDQDYPGSEIVVASHGDGYIYAFHADGTMVSGWPRYVGTNGFTPSTPAIGDLDPGYEGLEVIVGSGDGRLYAFHSDGSLVNGWPRSFGGSIISSPALTDLNKDGKLEVVVGIYGESDPYGIYVVNADGTLMDGWPQLEGGDVVSSPAIADIDPHYPGLEIVVGLSTELWAGPDCNCGAVYAFHADGTLVTEPWIVGDDINSSASIGDLDGNGTLEIAMGVDYYDPYPFIRGEVHILTLPWISPENHLPWPMFHKNIHRTGSNIHPLLTPIGTQYASINSFLIFQVSATDTDNDSLTYSATGLPPGATFNPTTRIFVWPRTPNKPVTYTTTFTVTDGYGGSDSEDVQIVIGYSSAPSPPKYEEME